MVTLECTATRHDGVTLVTGRLDNDGRPCHVRIANRLDGPVWPPRRRGVPAPGWDDDGFECELAAHETRPIGYASPAEALAEPLAVVSETAVDRDDGGSFEPCMPVPAVEATPAGVVRALGSPLPPADAVPGADEESCQPSRSGFTPCTGSGGDGDAARVESLASEHPAVDAWLESVADRIERATEGARSSDADGATAATGSVEGPTVGGGLEERVARDAVTLRAVAERAGRLADRAATVGGSLAVDEPVPAES